MNHGVKKQEQKELTPEEKKTIEDKLAKIIHINKSILQKRADKDYSE